MKKKDARLALSGWQWQVVICDRCGEAVVDVLHSQPCNDDRSGRPETWEQVPRALSRRDCQVMRDSVLSSGVEPYYNWHMPDVGRLALARWRDGYWFEALRECYEVALQTGVLVFEPFRTDTMREVHRVGDPWAIEAYAVARSLDSLGGVAVRAARDPALNWGFTVLANEWLAESGRE